LELSILLIDCVALLGSAILFYNRNRLRQKVKLLTEIQRQEKLREETIKQKENEERTRIARNIHDELGSGLSKVRLLTELARAEPFEKCRCDKLDQWCR
jgi:signal transduction histidine kinase